MKVLIHTQWFDPEPNTFKGLAFARELAANEFEISVLTGFPNYPEGKIYQNYSGLFPVLEDIDNIKIYRAPIFPSHDKSAIKRSLNYISFCISSLIVGLFISRPKIIYSYHPPITTAFSSWLLSKIWRVPWVLDIQDMWPETLESTGMINNSLFLSMIRKVCFFLYRRANKIVVLSAGFQSHLIKNNIDPDKIEVIYNWTNEDEEGSPENFNFKNPRHFNFTFAGNLGPGQNLLSFIEAFNHPSILKEKVSLNVFGEGTQKDEIKKFIDSNNLFNVNVYDRVSDRQIKTIFNSSNALVVHLKKDDLFKITIPSKTQAYLFSGKPILMASEGEAASIIENSKAGVLCEPENADSIVSAIKRLIDLKQDKIDEMGKNGKIFYNNEMQRSKGVIKFTKLFLELIKKK